MAANRPMNFWVVVKRAPDLPGWWIAHCLDIDVLSQGDSLQDALESIPEAVRIAVVDDLQMGREPLRRRAPDEYWAELAEIQRQGNPLFLTHDALHKQSPEIDALAV
jgi:predicted RNase H-like HicB family nuclease